MYIDKLDDTVNKFNDTHHSTIESKPVDVNKAHILILMMTKILNLKFLILLEYQNIKTFLQNPMFQIGLKSFSWLKKVKNTVP